MGKGKDTQQQANAPKKHFFNDERVQFTIGLFTVFLSIYIFIAFVSYIFTWHADQSLIWANLLPGSGIRVENWTGKLGAILAAQFMNNWFGLASIALPLIIFMSGIKMLKLAKPSIIRLTFKIIAGVLLFSLATGFIFGPTGGFLGSGIGGAHGLFMSNFLQMGIGLVGTALVVLLLCMAYMLYIVPNSMQRLQNLGHRIRERRALRAEKRQQLRAEKEQLQAAQLAQTAKTTTENQPQHTTQTSDNEPISINTDSPTTEPQEMDEVLPKPTSNHRNKDIGFEITPASPTALAPITPTLPAFTIQPAPEAEPAPIVPTPTPTPTPTHIAQNETTRTAPTTPASAATQTAPPPQPEITPEEEDDDEVQFTVEQTVTEGGEQADIEQVELYDPTLELSRYQLPPLELLEDYQNTSQSVTEDILIQNKNRIIETLQNYKIQIDRIKATIGPTVTLYEIVPAPGIRISKIKNLEDDIALSLAALGIRIIAPIPGKGTIGIEVPNEHPEVVSMHSIIRSQKFQESSHSLAIALGKTISNEIYVLDLAKLPHLLVAGATGQGKSVGLNAIIASLLYKKHPAELKFVLVDPKKVELSLYSKLERHFLAKLPDSDDAIITDTQKVVNTLNSLCIEMDQRYDLLKQAGAKSIKEYNDKFINRRLNPLKGHRYLPYIVVIIDEFADLIMTAGREVETPIARLAQLARAIGIHLIIATQRPSANIITGIIKANFPARIAFRVSSSIDSRTILDHTGANNLIGRGDMLVSAGSDMVRVQCAFIDTPEIERITDFIGNQQGYSGAFELPEYVPEGSGDGPADVDLRRRDDLFDDAARMVVQTQMGSTSQIQRKFSIGYNRAGRIMDQLEAAGIVGPFEGSKARQVLIVDEMSLEQLLNDLANR